MVTNLVDVMKRMRVVERICKVLSAVSGIPAGRIVDTSSLADDLELNSLERIEAAMKLEEEFEVQLSDDEVDQACMGTVGGIADYLLAEKGV